MTKRSLLKYFKTGPAIIRLAVMLYVRFPLSLRNVEDLLHERGIDVSHETIRFGRCRIAMGARRLARSARHMHGWRPVAVPFSV